MTGADLPTPRRNGPAINFQEMVPSLFLGLIIGFVLLYLLVRFDLFNPDSRYIREVMKHATYESLEDDGTCYGEIPGFDGVWANASTQGAREVELEEVLKGWIELRRSSGLPLPPANPSNLVAA